jgi:hypothetical protein
LHAVDHPAQAFEGRKRLEREDNEKHCEKGSNEEVNLLYRGFFHEPLVIKRSLAAGFRHVFQYSLIYYKPSIAYAIGLIQA